LVTKIELKEGEKKLIYFTLRYKVTNEIIDLTNASSITLQLQNYDNTIATIDTTVYNYNPSGGVVRWTVDATTLSAGRYFGEVEVWDAGGYVSKSLDFLVDIDSEIPR